VQLMEAYRKFGGRKFGIGEEKRRLRREKEKEREIERRDEGRREKSA